MQKKLIFLALTGLLCLSLAGCGQSGSTSPEGGSSPQAEQPAEEAAGEDGGRTPEEDGADTEAPQYTDNFSIDTEAVTAFAEQIQAAVAEKDLEALVDLASYPPYIGFSDGGESVESREDLIALEADRIFSEELVSEIAGADPGGAGPQQGRICPVRQRQAQCGVQCCRWQTGHCGNKLLTCSSAGGKRRLAAGEASLPEKLELLGRTIRYPELDAYSATQLLEQTEEHSRAQAEAAWCISRPTAVWPPVCCICGAARSTRMTIG